MPKTRRRGGERAGDIIRAPELHGRTVVVLRGGEDHSIHHQPQGKRGPGSHQVWEDGRARELGHLRHARVQGPGQQLSRPPVPPDVRSGGELRGVRWSPDACSGGGDSAEEQRER